MKNVLTPGDMKPGMKVRFTDKYIRFSPNITTTEGPIVEVVEVQNVETNVNTYYPDRTAYKITYKMSGGMRLSRLIDKFGKGIDSKIPIFCLTEQQHAGVENNDGRETCAWCGGSIKKIPGFNVTTTYDVCEDCGK